MTPALVSQSAGKAVSPRPREWFTPKEASAELILFGLYRSEKWFQQQCACGAILTNPEFPGRWQIPLSELVRLAKAEPKPAEGAA